MNPVHLFYRPEIDGLRAIAVVSVILYHAQMTILGRDWFAGGYIGVDIFFVISGYLITRIILSELKIKRSFNFMNFYERRARRILPMLFVVIFASMPLAWLKLLPSDYVEYADSVLASLYFGSNFFFYFKADYGADSALLKPFLHTWSLSVEEQFYLVFPILAVAIVKLNPRWFLSIIGSLSLLSIIFAQYMEIQDPDFNFYSPFGRFWELSVGSALAYGELNRKSINSDLFAKIMPAFGLCLVVYSILHFDGKTPHPSFRTIVPIMGVVLIVGFASRHEPVGQLLGSRPFVWVGLISYSAYLWHFPVFVFSRYGDFEGFVDEYKVYAIALVLMMSIISYLYVERPLRKQGAVSTKMFRYFLVLFPVIVVSLMMLIKQNRGFEYRINSVVSEKARSTERSLKVEPKVGSDLDLPKGKEIVLVIGDSYTSNWARIGEYVRPSYDVAVLQYLGCDLRVDKESVVRLIRTPDSKYISNCSGVLAGLANTDFLSRVAVVLLVSHRPFKWGANEFRFDLLSVVRKYAPKAEVFILGNYFQMNHKKNASCLKLMFKMGSDASICMHESSHNNVRVEKDDLNNKKYDTNIPYKHISIFELLKSEKGDYPFESYGVPFMFDSNHLTRSFVDLVLKRMSDYDGDSAEFIALKKYLSRPNVLAPTLGSGSR